MATDRYGFGEAVISEGYSHETLEGGLRWCRDAAPCLVGKSVGEARALLEPGIADFPSAASSLLSALDVLDGHPLLDVPETTRVPLLDPVHSHEPAALADEIEALIARGFRTLKVKVGFDAHADLERVRRIQTLLDGRAEIRLDANRGFTREDGCRFAAGARPAGHPALRATVRVRRLGRERRGGPGLHRAGDDGRVGLRIRGHRPRRGDGGRRLRQAQAQEARERGPAARRAWSASAPRASSR